MHDILLWHLDVPEERSFLESMYIIMLIRLAEEKLNVKYRRILDVACGVGRHHRYLRDAGFNVYGIDANRSLIEEARRRNPGFEECYEVADMRELKYRGEFDVVLNWYTSFGYFSDEENRLVLRNFYEALKPGGLLIMDLPARWHESASLIEHGEDLVEVITNKRIDDYVFDYCGRLYRRRGNDLVYLGELRLRLTVYPPAVLKDMLEEAGFKLLYAFLNYSVVPVRSFRPEEILERNVRRIAWLAHR